MDKIRVEREMREEMFCESERWKEEEETAEEIRAKVGCWGTPRGRGEEEEEARLSRRQKINAS